jgi:hypothetical protein
MTRIVVFHAVRPELRAYVHGDADRGNWDVFSDDTRDTADSLGLYEMASCPHATKFAKKHPELRYVGSEDNLHSYPNRPPKEVD